MRKHGTASSLLGRQPVGQISAHHASQHVSCSCSSQQRIPGGVNAGKLTWSRHNGSRPFKHNYCAKTVSQRLSGSQTIGLHSLRGAVHQTGGFEGVRSQDCLQCQATGLGGLTALDQSRLKLGTVCDSVERIGIQYQLRGLRQKLREHRLNGLATTTTRHNNLLREVQSIKSPKHQFGLHGVYVERRAGYRIVGTKFPSIAR